MGEYLRMISFKIKTGLLTTLILFCTICLPTLAQENIISSVVISKSKEKPNAYELSIDSTEAVDYKANIDEEGDIYFDLKNSTVAEDAGTIYDDVSNIDNVVIKQLNNNKVRIYVKGKNARNTELVFVNSLFDTSKETSKKVIINRPINEYQPTNRLNDLDDEEIQDWNDNSFNFAYLLVELLSSLKKGSTGIVLIFLTLLGLGAIIIKNLALKISQDKEPLIGLNTTKINNNDLRSVSNRMEALKNAQDELNKAHQKYQSYLQNKYKDNYKEKAKPVNIDAIKKGIALNQYQKSTQNPYLDQEVIKINKDFTSSIPQGNFQIPPRPKKPAQINTSPYIQRKNNKIDYIPKTNEKSSSTKFLESVTKIYEQSGRKDLANGLKNSISKAKQSI